MVTPLRAYLGLLALLSVQRLAELVLSRRHERILLARGAVEAGSGHYPPMVAMHVLFLVACATEAVRAGQPPSTALAVGALLMLGAAQVVRWWAILSLGERWTTTILTLPGAAPIVTGPYRFIRHPNYLAVVVEMAAVPLVFGCWRTALLFSVSNAVVIGVRIAAEEHALGAGWQRAFRDRPRLLPGRPRDAS